MKMYRQGEVLIKKVTRVYGNKQNHLVLAYGEKTGHKHEVTTGDATLYEKDGTLYLSCDTECVLTHPDHKEVIFKPGDYEITVQREYVVGDEKYRQVAD